MINKDITIVSDLHLGTGRSPSTGTYSRHEEFFYDMEFAEFTDYLISHAKERNKPHMLILNGDILDYLAVKELPSSEEIKNSGFKLSKNELKYGLGSSEKKAVWKTRKILEGHRDFFTAIARLLYHGHEVLYIRGNHDLELHWKSIPPLISDYVKNLLLETGSADGHEIENFRFKEWFHVEGGELYVEHGNQYENTNALSEQFNPELPGGAYGREEKLLNYPIGSLFARYVYSQVRNLDPYRTHVISFAQYLSITRTYNIWDFIRTLYFNFPFFVRAARNSFEIEDKSMKDIASVHREKMLKYAETENISEEQIKKINNLKAIPLGHSGYDIFTEMFKPFIKHLITFSLLVLITIFGWFLIFTAISHVLESSVFGKASIMAILAVLTFSGIFVVFTKLGKAISSYEDPLVGDIAAKAEEISKILDVKYVVMGHTHMAEKVTFDNGAVYVNTGAWIIIPGPWDILKRHGRQFTFARYEDGELKLYRWDISMGKPVYPILLSPASDRVPLEVVMSEDFIHNSDITDMK